MIDNILGFPDSHNLEFPAQQDKRELWFLVIDGHPPARRKRILLEARAAGYLSSQDTRIFVDACGLGGA